MDAESGFVSTGALPPAARLEALLDEAMARFGRLAGGRVADYIPALAGADPDGLGIALVAVDGGGATAGDCAARFSLQSLSKPFVFALVSDRLGAEEARTRLGVNATGMPFDSVMAIELGDIRRTNPMVNAGAIAAASFAPGKNVQARWDWLLEGISAFAGRPLALNDDVFASEMATNKRNRGIAALLDSYGKLGCPPDEALDCYTRQCALDVTVDDVAVMAATLANGGVNPRTGESVVPAAIVKRALAVLAVAGLYEQSGDWLFDIGLPGKSGVSGGILTVAPGKGGLAVWSPPLDAAGNSVRGRAITRWLSDAMGLNLFASAPR